MAGIGVAFIAQFAPAAATAQDACPPADWVRAVELTRKAKAFLDSGDFEQSLSLLKAAFAVCPEPKLHRSMGRVFQESGRTADAIVEYQACADTVNDEAIRTECAARADELRALVAAAATPVSPVAETETDTRDDAADQASGDVAAGATSGLPDDGATTDITASTRPRKRAGATAAGTEWNWVGLGLGAVATGLGVAFFVQYGMDLAAAQPMHYDPEAGGWWAADEVGPRNVALGASFTAAGLLAVILSATLWPDAPVTISAAPVEGGGIVGVKVGM